MQMLLKPVTSQENNYPARGLDIVDRLVSRPEKKDSTFMQDVGAAGVTVATGKAPNAKEEEEPHALNTPLCLYF